MYSTRVAFWEDNGPVSAESQTALQPWSYWEAMVRAADRIVGDSDEASDCAAEALTQFLEKPPREIGNLEALLVSMSKRRAIDSIRRAERARRKELRASAQQLIAVTDVAETVTGRAEAIWMEEQARLLLRPDVYRLVTMIADGASLEEAARRLNWTRGSAAAHLLRARRTLRTALARTLVGLATALGAIRRQLVPVAGSATAAAALLLWSVGPVGGPDPSATPEAPIALPVTAPDTTLDSLSHGSTAEVLRGRESRSVPIRVASEAGHSREIARIDTPAGGARVDREEDDRDEGDYAQRLIACVERLEISIGGDVGCPPD